MTNPPCSKSNISLVNGRLNNQEQQQKYNYKVMHTISNTNRFRTTKEVANLETKNSALQPKITSIESPKK